MSGEFTRLGSDGVLRDLDEAYDTIEDVIQDPTGAHQAIQSLSRLVANLQQELEATR